MGFEPASFLVMSILITSVIEVAMQQEGMMQGFNLKHFLSWFSSPQPTNNRTCEPHLTISECDQVAVVDEQICLDQRGRVRYRGSYWYAISEQDICILPGTRVLVIGREGLTLIVKPLTSGQKQRLATQKNT